MSDLKEITLMPGEQILHRIEGDAYNYSPNPMMKVLGKIDKLVGKIYGKSNKVYFVQTTNRVLVVEKGMIFWKFPRGIITKSLSKSSIDILGYTQANRWLIFKSLYFDIGLRSGEAYAIKFTGKLPALVTIANDVNQEFFSNTTPLKQVA